MITAHPDSYVFSLLEILSVVGEFPVRSLSLMGNERVIKALIHRCREVQQIRMHREGKVYHIQLFNVSGHGKQKTLRLTKDALALLKELYPAALPYYLSSFREHRFTGNEKNIDRNHRIAESVAMCRAAGAEFRPYLLPELQTDHAAAKMLCAPACYISRQIKQSEQDDMNKIGFTRTTGMLFSPDNAFALYNARGTTMKWSGTGEFKAYHHLNQLVRFNSAMPELENAILFAENSTAAISTLKETEKSNRMDTPFSSIYPHIHFIPLDRDGVELLRMLIQTDFRTKLLSVLLPESVLAHGRNMSIDCDGETNGHYILSHLDGDIARLMAFARNSQVMPDGLTFEVVCYPWQFRYVRELTCSEMKVTCIPVDVVRNVLTKQMNN